MRSMHVIRAIALNTFRETVRDRVLYAIVIFALLSTIAGTVFGALSASQDLRILVDLGLATIGLFGGVIALFIGTTLVYKEIDRRTIYLIVTKPIKRWEFVSGKFLGLALCILATNFGMGLFFQLVLFWQTGNLNMAVPLLASLSLIYLELVFVVALATFFSTFCTPLMSMIFSFGIWLVGHLSFSFEMLKVIALKASSPFAAAVADGLLYVMPDLARLTEIRSSLMDGLVVPSTLLVRITIYIVAYVVLLLACSSMIAERKEFN